MLFFTRSVFIQLFENCTLFRKMIQVYNKYYQIVPGDGVVNSMCKIYVRGRSFRD